MKLQAQLNVASTANPTPCKMIDRDELMLTPVKYLDCRGALKNATAGKPDCYRGSCRLIFKFQRRNRAVFLTDAGREFSLTLIAPFGQSVHLTEALSVYRRRGQARREEANLLVEWLRAELV